MAGFHDSISKESFEELCFIQCTPDEICACLGCSLADLNEWTVKTYGCDFPEAYKKGRKAGLLMLSNRLKGER